MTLAEVALWDSLLIVITIIVIATRPGITLFHPLTWILAFHILTVAARIPAILAGSPRLFDVDVTAVASAVQYADGFLLVALLLSIATPTGPVTAWRHSEHNWAGPSVNSWPILIMFSVGVGALTVGLTAGGPGAGASGTFVDIAMAWPSFIIVLNVLRRGATAANLLALIAASIPLILQGDQRFRVILPLAFLALCVVARRRQSWPSRGAVGALLVALVLFYPLDALSAAARNGTLNSSTAWTTISEANQMALSGTTQDQSILDQAAIAEKVTRDNGVTLWGEPYLAFFSAPIPRSIWPDKPAQNESVRALSSDRFPLDKVGAVTTLPGDLLVNFGDPLALALWAGLVAIWLRAYRAFLTGNHPGGDIMYLLILALSFQILRDGLLSLFIFGTLFGLPVLVYSAQVAMAQTPKESRVRSWFYNG